MKKEVNEVTYKDLNPIEILRDWVEDELRINQNELNPMTLCTFSLDKGISSRVVLLKEIDSDERLLFYTNYKSKKALELEANPKVSATIYWDQKLYQVNLKGTVTKTSRETSVAYWKTRALASQISQYISLQSQPLESKEKLLTLYNDAKEKFNEKSPPPCPDHWGGYAITVEEIELWLGNKIRLHDRFLYKKNDNRWQSIRLYP